MPEIVLGLTEWAPDARTPHLIEPALGSARGEVGKSLKTLKAPSKSWLHMKIVIVSAFYSEGMGYAENCLPKFMASLGHEVHVITSTLNVYGNSPDYSSNYEAFLGAAEQPASTTRSEGYFVHRLPYRLVSSYVSIKGLVQKIRSLQPDVVHCTEIASLSSFAIAAAKPRMRFSFFAESHQHMSVVKPFLKQPGGAPLKKAVYWCTRTLPSALASMAMDKCYAIAPDCLEVAHRFYGVPRSKLVLQPLGTDTYLFRPVQDEEMANRRAALRESLGYAPSDVVCIYTGRFTGAKNPLALAAAADQLAAQGQPFHALFIGEGPQKDEILKCRNTQVIPFMKHRDLADYYRAADVAVWPRQESMSMLDAAACGVPIVVSDEIGEAERVTGNGRFYKENDVSDLATVLASLASAEERRALGKHGSEKMLAKYSWLSVANAIERDYLEARRA